jgi:predicted RNA binding protein YcfA (HicA-like mRNA interferase family)
LVDGFYSAVAKELRQLGYRHLNNAKGSHEKWVGPAGRTLIVPRHLKSRHTANAILKDSGSDMRL